MRPILMLSGRSATSLSRIGPSGGGRFKFGLAMLSASRDQFRFVPVPAFIYGMLVEQPCIGVGRMSTAFKRCLILLCLSLTCESLSVFIFSANQTVLWVQLSRALFVAYVIGGLFIFSQMARYVGGVFLGISAIYTAWSVYSAVTPPPFLIGTLIIAAALFELSASYLLCVSNSFRAEFAKRIAGAPPIFQQLRRSFLVAIVAILVALLGRDILNLIWT